MSIVHTFNQVISGYIIELKLAGLNYRIEGNFGGGKFWRIAG